MAVFAEEWPWLRKPEAIVNAVRLIGDSAVAARGLVGYLDEAEGEMFWHPPRSERELGRIDPARPFQAPDDTLSRCLAHLVLQRRDLPAGTFVFVLSDFLVPPSRDEWLRVLERRFEVVPVVVLDPVWERSFPDVSGTVVPFADDGGRVRLVALSAREANARREANEERHRDLAFAFRALDMEPVQITTHEWRDVVFAFLTWADQRMMARGHA
jgi:hypothetical protein